MKMKKIAALLAIAAASGSAFATNGYFSHGFGIKAKSMGGVGIALPQDSLAAASNPAGMAMVGDRLDVGLDLFAPIRTATWTATNGAYNRPLEDSKSGRNLFAVPELGYNKMLGWDMAVGINVYGNGGMNTDYGKVVISGAATNTYSNLEQMFIAPTFAWKINKNHTIGVSLNLVFQNFEARGLESFAVATQSSAPESVTNRGKDYSTGLGLKLGWTGQISPAVTLGATYQPKTSMSRFDKYKGLFAQQGKFDIPETYGLGIAYKANDKLTVAADVVQINYGAVKSIANNGDKFPGVAGTLLGSENGSGFGWGNQTVYKLGMSYQYAPNLLLRAGYNHAKTPLGSTQTFFNILAPATVEDHLTLGATWTLADKSELSLSYMHAFEKKVTGVGTGNGGCVVAFGCGGAVAVSGHPVDLKMHQNALGIAYGMKF
ncbi:aromatic hydrocarbon degradation membrane protein [Sulfuritalea hydrogenivorans sk43H]|uniref:Aromatic hydrocarbon degradation membrane protein n=2 Tax=Sulfuritalea hydrogenivorans TaxID=748811 RepID=W0SI07_9PROT|nr:aromatic hydrocarbon degradation membrane protein [Sulfuritalea hydrogenivorans sk43H]